MAAFRSAVEIGAHAIETDLHLSRDGVVVLSHVSLRRLGQSNIVVSAPDDQVADEIIGSRMPR